VSHASKKIAAEPNPCFAKNELVICENEAFLCENEDDRWGGSWAELGN
jgi:hypothetical protein